VNRRFEPATFSAAASTWPYANAQKKWTWTATYEDTLGSGPVAVNQQLVGQTAETFIITPTRVGTYTISLNIDDGCASASAKQFLVTSCAVTSNAVVAPSTHTIEFDSFLGAAGAFPDLTIDGSGSTGSAQDTLSYRWSRTRT